MTERENELEDLRCQISKLKCEMQEAAESMKVWMVCEAFTLTEDHTTIHRSMCTWALPCADRKTAMRELRKCVRERVLENYEGCTDGDDDIRCDIDEVLSHPMKPRRGSYVYNYSTSDREIVWRVYPCEVGK